MNREEQLAFVRAHRTAMFRVNCQKWLSKYFLMKK